MLSALESLAVPVAFQEGILEQRWAEEGSGWHWVGRGRWKLSFGPALAGVMEPEAGLKWQSIRRGLAQTPGKPRLGRGQRCLPLCFCFLRHFLEIHIAPGSERPLHEQTHLGPLGTVPAAWVPPPSHSLGGPWAFFEDQTEDGQQESAPNGLGRPGLGLQRRPGRSVGSGVGVSEGHLQVAGCPAVSVLALHVNLQLPQDARLGSYIPVRMQ